MGWSERGRARFAWCVGRARPGVDSGASKWTAQRREQYANDLDAERSLVAVSLGPNRTKGDKDPAEWMPPAKDATCTYVADWVAAKLRWKLTVDQAEQMETSDFAAAGRDRAHRYCRGGRSAVGAP
ncbi:hypothetical protein [Streptomyces sp. bgisy084]|uniref:hypothetical protein n=1 Tax=Streptomyces sp. bgisy084 TaxID=3413777 RepID=UPI003D760609